MSIRAVLENQSRYCLLTGDCLALLRGMPDSSVDLIFGSPPYAEKGERYGDGAKRWKTADWLDWMLPIIVEGLRVSRGYVLLVVNGAVRRGRYLPACEGLVWRAHESGIICERPCIWHKNAPPNRRDWFGNNWEYVLAFKPAERGSHFDWESVAQPPKYTNGGQFRQRDANGARRLGNQYPKNKLARPRDVVRVTVGGGHLGSPLAHENEAPFPEKLAEHFVLACCPLEGLVLDPFSGSGTTGAVALKTGRRYIGFDIRESQSELAQKRFAALALPSAPGQPGLHHSNGGGS